MKKNHIINLYKGFLIIILLSFFACKKYPDGPTISLTSAKNRLYGSWIVDKYFIDNNDLTVFYNDSCGCKLYFYKKKDSFGTLDLSNRICFSNCVHQSFFTFSEWQFQDKNRYLLFDDIDSVKYYNKFFPRDTVQKSTKWKIFRLTHNDMWIKTTINNKEHFIKLKHKGV